MRVVQVEEDVELTVAGRRHVVRSVAHERCLRCGERIFGLEVSRRMDEETLRRRRRRHAA